MASSDAAKAAPALAGSDPRNEQLGGGLDCKNSETARRPQDGLFAEAAAEYRESSTKPHRESAAAPYDEMAQHSRLSFVHELLGTIAREAIATQLFAEELELDFAHEYLAKLTLDIKALLKTWDEIMSAERRRAK